MAEVMGCLTPTVTLIIPVTSGSKLSVEDTSYIDLAEEMQKNAQAKYKVGPDEINRQIPPTTKSGSGLLSVTTCIRWVSIPITMH